MVIEQVQLNVIPGREDECLSHLAANRSLLLNSKGCRSMVFGRGVENPSKVMLAVGWDSLEDHKAATQSAEFAAFSKGLVGMVTGATAEHFTIAAS